jgi:hypothetical protein
LQKLKQHLFNFIWRYFAGCREVTEMASALIDKEDLPWRKRFSMRIHILTCQGCQNYLSHLKFMREVFRHPENEKISTTLSPEAKERIKNAVRSASS